MGEREGNPKDHLGNLGLPKLEGRKNQKTMAMVLRGPCCIPAQSRSAPLHRPRLSRLQASASSRRAHPSRRASSFDSQKRKRASGGFRSPWRHWPWKCNAAAAEGAYPGPKSAKEQMDPLHYLPWALGFAVIYITREAVLVELLGWAAAGRTLFLLLISFAFLILQKILLIARKPVELTIFLLGSAILFIKLIYTVIVVDTNAWSMAQSLVLSTIILSLGEATRTDAVRRQILMLNVAHLFGVAGVLGFLHGGELLLLLFALTGISFLIQRKDAVISLMPMISVLISIAEPWLRGVALASFLACAVYRNWKTPEEAICDDMNKPPLQTIILYAVAVMVGMRIAAQWLCMRHLHWLAK